MVLSAQPLAIFHGSKGLIWFLGIPCVRCVKLVDSYTSCVEDCVGPDRDASGALSTH